jgi:hypothetical protein
MPKAPKTVFDRVQKLGLELPDVEVGTTWGAPALKVGGKMFACIPSNKSAEPDSLAVRMSFLERDLRLRAEPDAYYLKPHYEGYPCVLVRVKQLKDAALRDLLETGYAFVRSSGAKARKSGRRA